MELPKKIKWGIIGCGAVTEVKSGPPYKSTKDFELVAVMRRNIEKAADYAKRHQISKFYDNADDLILDDEVDAVYIATPPDSHKLYALKVAKADKICCVEKPLSPSYEDSLVIYNAFKKKEIPLFVAYYRRSLPRFLKVKEWLDAEKIGKIRHIRWHLSKPANDFDKSGAVNWRTDAAVAPGGYFDDLASHGLDLFVYLLGPVEKAVGLSINQQGLYTAKDAITSCWIHTNGITGEGSWNFGTSTREDKVEIIGSTGKIKFSVFKEEAIICSNSKGTESLFIENPKHVQQFHVENMRKHLIKNQQHPSTGETALHTSWIMDSILENIS